LLSNRKKKKKKKKKVTIAEVESVDTTAPPSGTSSASLTPVLAPTSNTFAVASFDQFDPFNSDIKSSFATSVLSNSGSAMPATSGFSMSPPLQAESSKKGRRKKEEVVVAAPAPFSNGSFEPKVVSDGTFDLTDFASIPTPRASGGSSRDLDILTGTNAPAAPLEDMFRQTSLMDDPIQGMEEDGFVVEDEPALLDQPVFAPTNVEVNGYDPKSPVNNQKKDLWDLATNFTNIDNIKSSAPQKKKVVQEVVSMSMMRSTNQIFSSSSSAPSALSFGMPQAGNNMNNFSSPQPNAFSGAGFGAPQQIPLQMQYQMQMQQQMQQFQPQAAPNASNAFDFDLPFAAAPSSSKQNGSTGKAVFFDSVPQARPATALTAPVASGPRWT